MLPWKLWRVCCALPLLRGDDRHAQSLTPAEEEFDFFHHGWSLKPIKQYSLPIFLNAKICQTFSFSLALLDP
jgi:hypothetical protein